MLEKKLIRSGEGARITWNEPVGGWRGYRGHTLVVRVPNSRYNTFRVADAVTEGIQGQPQMTFENERQAQEWLNNHPGFSNWRVGGTKRDYTCVKIPLEDGSECWLAESNFPTENSPEWNRLVELYPSYFRTGPGFFTEDWKTHELTNNEITDICLSTELTDDEKCMKLWGRPYARVIKGANSLLYVTNLHDMIPEYPEGKTREDLYNILHPINVRYHNPGGLSVMWFGNDLSVADAFNQYTRYREPIIWRSYIGELTDEYEKFFGLNKQLGFFKESVVNTHFTSRAIEEIMENESLSNDELAHKLWDRPWEKVKAAGDMYFFLAFPDDATEGELDVFMDKVILTDLEEQVEQIHDLAGASAYSVFMDGGADEPLEIVDSYKQYVVNGGMEAADWWLYVKKLIEKYEEYAKPKLGFFKESVNVKDFSENEVRQIMGDKNLSDQEKAHKLFDRDEDWVCLCGGLIYTFHDTHEREKLEQWLGKPIPTCPEGKDEYDLKAELDDLNEQLCVGPYTYFCRSSFGGSPLRLTESYTEYVMRDSESAHTWWEYTKLCIETVEDFYGKRGFTKPLGFFSESLIGRDLTGQEVIEIMTDSLSEEEKCKKLFNRELDWTYLCGGLYYALLDRSEKEHLVDWLGKDFPKTPEGKNINLLQNTLHSWNDTNHIPVWSYFCISRFNDNPLRLNESFNHYVLRYAGSQRTIQALNWWRWNTYLIEQAEQFYNQRGFKKPLGFFSESKINKSFNNDEIKEIMLDESLTDDQKARKLFDREAEWTLLCGKIYYILDRLGRWDTIEDKFPPVPDGKSVRDLMIATGKVRTNNNIGVCTYSVCNNDREPFTLTESFDYYIMGGISRYTGSDYRGRKLPSTWFNFYKESIEVVEDFFDIDLGRRLGFFTESVNVNFTEDDAERILDIVHDSNLTDDQKCQKLWNRDWLHVKEAENLNYDKGHLDTVHSQIGRWSLLFASDNLKRGYEEWGSGKPYLWWKGIKNSVEYWEGQGELSKPKPELGFFNESKINKNFSEEEIKEIMASSLSDKQKSMKLFNRDDGWALLLSEVYWITSRSRNTWEGWSNDFPPMPDGKTYDDLYDLSYRINLRILSGSPYTFSIGSDFSEPFTLSESFDYYVLGKPIPRYRNKQRDSRFLIPATTWFEFIKEMIEGIEEFFNVDKGRQLGFFNESTNLTESYNVSPEVFKRVIIKYVKENGYIKGDWNGRYPIPSPTVEAINRILRNVDNLDDYMCTPEEYHGMDEWVNRTTPEGPQADWTRKCIDSWNKESDLQLQDLKNLVAFTSLYVNGIKYQQRQQARQEREREHQANVDSETNTWAGEIGDTVEFTIQECKIAFWIQPRSYYANSYPCWTIKGTDGRTYTWNDTKQEVTLEPGMRIKGKIKKLTEFRGIKQTQVWRIEITSSHGTSLGFFTESFGYDEERVPINNGEDYEVHISPNQFTKWSEWESLPCVERIKRLINIVHECNSTNNERFVVALPDYTNHWYQPDLSHVTEEDYERIAKAFASLWTDESFHKSGLYNYHDTPEQVLRDAWMWDTKLGLPLIKYPLIGGGIVDSWLYPIATRNLGFFNEDVEDDKEPTSGELNRAWLKQNYGITDKELRGLCDINWERQDDNDFGMSNEKWGVRVVHIFFDDCGYHEFDSLDEAASFYGEQFVKDWIDGFVKHYKDDIEELNSHKKSQLGFFSRG